MSVAVIVAVDVNADGRREVLGMDIGRSEIKRTHRGCRHLPMRPPSAGSQV